MGIIFFVRFQFHEVQLKGIRNNSNGRISLFQFHEVQLKELQV